MTLYRIYWKDEISCAHKLNLPYSSKSNNLHGHNYKIQIEVSDSDLNENGMLIDFSQLKSIVRELDHQYLNDFLDQPTAERLAEYIHSKVKDAINSVYPHINVHVWEDERSRATYED